MQLDQLLQQAKQKCKDAGGRFTEKRGAVLKTLLQAEAPISAYELVDRYNQAAPEPIKAMSAYRILDFFVELNLVHKLSASNKYVACSHLACNHSHQDQFFVICQECGATKEITIPSSLMQQLTDSVSAEGFQLKHSQFELEGMCQACLAKSSPES